MSHSFNQYSELADLLSELQMAMEAAQVWECSPPSAQAMASQQPFCIDTMRFEQWLRYVLIARFNTIIQTQQRLPTRCHISPMIEDAFRGVPPSNVKHLMLVADAIDRFLSRVASQ